MALGGAPGISIIIEAVDKFSGTLDDMEGKIGTATDEIRKKVGVMGAAMTAAGIGGAIALGSMASTAATYESVMAGVSTKVEDVTALQSELQAATFGTISKLDLMTSASKGLQLGITEDVMPAMAEFSAKVAPALGESAQFMFDSIITGTARASPLILDNLGIMIDTEQVYKDAASAAGLYTSEIQQVDFGLLTEQQKHAAFGAGLLTDSMKVMGFSDMNEEQRKAAIGIGLFTEETKLNVDALTEQQKSMALMDAVTKEATVRGIELGDIEDQSAVKIAQATAAWTDAKLVIGDTVLPIFTKIAEILSSVFTWFNNLNPSILKFVGVTAALVVGALLIIGPFLSLLAILPMLVALLPVITAGFGLLVAGVSALFAPVALAVLILVGLIAIGYLLVTNWEEIKTKIFAIWNAISTTVTSVWGTIKDTFSDVWNSIKDTAISVWDSITGYISDKVNSMIDIINLLISAFNTVSGKVGGVEIPSIPNIGETTAVSDFVVTPNGTLQTDPNDYIIGTKHPESLGGGRGIVINIGTISGVDADDIASALERKLTTLISI